MTPRAPDPARRNERSRQAILSAALDLIGELTYPKVTIEAIASRAGVGKQTIYRWWPSKAAVVFDAFMMLNKGGSSEVVLPDTGDFAADMRVVLHATVAEFADPRYASAYRALNTDVQDDPALAEQMLARVLRPTLEAVKERLRAAQRAGQIDTGIDLDVAIELIYAPLYHRWLLRTGPMTTAYADQVLDLALRALRPQ
ncbi:TetR/AcrR family transcriptional regulator [Nonomuraea sp. NPDC046570]|uniref:TetR/AcrR family transcriptional regulator n=1 Tax=Nonomuraea sp. NPDC046570 TaxID=3155255 RepID=UPI003410ACCE